MSFDPFFTLLSIGYVWMNRVWVTGGLNELSESLRWRFHSLFFTLLKMLNVCCFWHQPWLVMRFFPQFLFTYALYKQFIPLYSICKNWSQVFVKYLLLLLDSSYFTDRVRRLLYHICSVFSTLSLYEKISKVTLFTSWWTRPAASAI